MPFFWAEVVLRIGHDDPSLNALGCRAGTNYEMFRQMFMDPGLDPARGDGDVSSSYCGINILFVINELIYVTQGDGKNTSKIEVLEKSS